MNWCLAHGGPSRGSWKLLAADRVGGCGVDGCPGLWLERNRRVVLRYQAWWRSASALDALIDQDVTATVRTQSILSLLGAQPVLNQF